MSEVIWKYTISFDGVHNKVPLGSELLDVQLQNGIPVAWFKVDPTQDLVPRRIWIFGTGHNLPFSHGEYVSTFQVEGLVFHVFDQGDDRSEVNK